MESKNPYTFPLKPEQYAPAPVPSLAEWKQLWRVWDLVTTKMIPPDALMEQPIPLRNPLLFYLGHIPTFEDIHLARATNSKPTEPAYYHQIFERGIDPDVDDPSKCHDHSELPEVFPFLGDILQYREHVKARITALYDSEKPYADRCIGRALWIGFEHEGLHVETFLLRKARKRSCFSTPSESQTPATWSKTRDARGDEDHTTFVARHSIKTVWGPLPLSQALDWPVMASFDEVERYAQWVGARLATLHELRSIHEHVKRRRKAPASKVNHQFHTDAKAIFVDLSDTNSGFRNFHPMGITHKDQLCGLGDTGGAAEWTRTLFAPQPGFKPMDIYPGYSADFMVQKHLAIVGGSWALHPRIAGRKTFLNWWQKKYLWPWVTFRLVRDIV
ncbi:Ergothioneine biosynthesis protein 1 [Fusarium oxysporum f. sp. rapae]|uniref:Ergothioneine biosynthesis protein 1 n=1 Tax=Fusarium oxysporum f. sp. rapae TaxID=485398 RepID=A0A8J5NJB4_FUSOX|nr:Ergothioneine biosynthesis protein 1 [Fusarium oxysporum f. sp. rapae]